MDYKKEKIIPVQQRRSYTVNGRSGQSKRSNFCCGCYLAAITLFLAILCISLLLFIPAKTNILIIGIDYTELDSNLGRSDTIIISTINPFKPYFGMLSIPRDLWVFIPGFGENRINTVHYFAELEQINSGPIALMETIESNFGIHPNYYIRIKFDGFRDLINAFGGVDIELTEPMAGYPPGNYHLSGRKALAFVRHRTNSDDFFRMENGQFMVKQLIKQILNPRYWTKLPKAFDSFHKHVDTNIPVWIWPRIIVTILRTGVDGIDNRIIDRDMVTPYVTNQGASVLLPDWAKIAPIINDIFEK